MEDTEEEPALLEVMTTWFFLRMGMRIEVVSQKILGTLDELYECQPQQL